MCGFPKCKLRYCRFCWNNLQRRCVSYYLDVTKLEKLGISPPKEPEESEEEEELVVEIEEETN